MRRFLLTLIISSQMAASCSFSDQSSVHQALSGSNYEACLAEAHWTAATRTGVLTYNPWGGGSMFVALDRAIAKPIKIEDYFFAPLPVGRAREVIDQPLEEQKKAYVKAGSPLAPYSEVAQFFGFGPEMVAVNDELSGVGSVRGVATGWLSQEANLHCATDGHNGRYFIIATFAPSFP